MHLPDSLGKILKRIRESKNLSIEEVSERSRIPRHIVSIIEEDRLNEIKSIFYAKSFVKTYAAFLGALDESGVKEYIACGIQQQQKKPEIKEQNRGQACLSPIKYKKQLLLVMAGIFILWAGYFAIGQVSRFIKNASTKKQAKIAIVKKESPKKAEKEKPKAQDAIKDVKKETSYEKYDSVELEVSALENTWLQIIVDGNIVFTGLFKKGSRDTWKAKKEIKLEAGNSGVIKMSVNGKPASFSGKKGEKKEIIITKDGIK
jgi:cytoskeletal protein RodZ